MFHGSRLAFARLTNPQPLLCPPGNPRRKEDVYLRRRTARIKLSKYAAYNTYHHCEQCHQYTGFNPGYQVS
jgi:hypothetical protein